MKPSGWLRKAAGACIAQPLNRLGVTRDQIITVRIATGLLAAIALAAGPAWFATGGALFLVGILLERSDAKHAQLCDRQVSEQYHFVAYCLPNALLFAGLGIGLRASEYGMATIVMGVVAAIAVTALPWLIKRLEIIDGARSPELDGFAGFDADDLLLLVPVVLWAGWALALLFVASFGVSTLAVALYLTHYRKFNAE